MNSKLNMTGLALVLAVALSACSKDVSKGPGNNLTPITPISDTPTSGVKTMHFTEYGEGNASSAPASSDMRLTLPDVITNTTYNNANLHDNLVLFVNNVEVCSYVWSNSAKQYQKVVCRVNGQSVTQIEVETGVRLSLVGIPFGQTATLQVPYQLLQ